MIRQIIHIDEEKCNGCGICTRACHEGALAIVDGKARLLRDDYCDGMGDCLPGCPQGALSFENREADAYDEQAVAANKQKKAAAADQKKQAAGKQGCPGTRVKVMFTTAPVRGSSARPAGAGTNGSQLRNWPVQIKLAPLSAPYYAGADILIAADCTAYARASFHADFMAGRVTLIGCPKLDAVDYSEKLTHIFASNDVKSVTVVRMQVPCCGGMEKAVWKAIEACGKDLPCSVITLTSEGNILN